jgi:hypothetical protein
MDWRQCHLARFPQGCVCVNGVAWIRPAGMGRCASGWGGADIPPDAHRPIPMRGGSRPDHRRTHQTLRGNLQTNSPSRYWTTKVSPARCACPNPSNRLDVRRSCLASKKTILEADEQPRAQTATEEPCLWVPEGNLAGICWVGLWGLGGPWGL